MQSFCFFCTVCPNGGELKDIDSNNEDGFRTSDNYDSSSGDGPNNSNNPSNNVDAFDTNGATITPSDDATPYTVTILTPNDSSDIPMEVDITVADNVDVVKVYVDGEYIGQVIA